MGIVEFETTTQTKIKTPHGTVLKVTRYCPGEYPEIEYKVKPACVVCGEPTCLCFSEYDEFDFDDAKNQLKYGFCCDGLECILSFTKDHHTGIYEELKQKYEDEHDLYDAIMESYTDGDDGPSECGV